MLYQASNISPSTIGGIGNSVVDVEMGLPISWQINGTSPITGYKIDIYRNNTESTFVWTSGDIQIPEPIYPIDYNGKPQYINVNFNSESQSPDGSFFNLMNGVSYKFKITQYWKDEEGTKKIEQIVANVFYAKTTPVLMLKKTDGTSIPSINNSRIIEVKGEYIQQQNTPISEVIWSLYRIYEGTKELVDEKTIYNTQVLKYKYETLIFGNEYRIELNVVNSDGKSTTTFSQFYVNYSSEITIENLSIKKEYDKTANLITWSGMTYISGETSGDTVYIDNEPNYGEKCIGIGFWEERIEGTGTERTFNLSKKYNALEPCCLVYINGYRMSPDYFSITTKESEDENDQISFTNIPGVGDSILVIYKTKNVDESLVEFNRINYEEMSNAKLSIDNNIIWQGSIESESCEILTVYGYYTNDLGAKTGDYKMEIVNSNGYIRILLDGIEQAKTQSRINPHQKEEYKYDWWTIIIPSLNNTIEKDRFVIIINKYEFIYPLYPNMFLYPNQKLYPRDKAIKTRREIFDKIKNNRKGRITGIKIGGGQWCDYIRVDDIPLGYDSLEKIIPNKDSNSSFDLYESERVVGNYLLANFNGNLDAGDNSGTVFSGSVIIREEKDSGKRDLLTIISTKELGKIYDYGIKSGKSYRYIVYGQGDTSLSSAVVTNYVCSKFQSHSLIVARKRTDDLFLEETQPLDSNLDNQYIVEKEYLFRYNSSFGSISNNSKVNYISNFTRYPGVQVGGSNYKSGTISGLIGSMEWANRTKTTLVSKYISKDFAKNFAFGGSAYIVGAGTFTSSWLSFQKGGLSFNPISNTVYIVKTPGPYFNIGYFWDGKKYSECGQQIEENLIQKNYRYEYRDSLESANEIMDLSIQPNKHFFIKDMKGGFYKVDISQPMSMNTKYENEYMPITMQINWVEIGSTENVVLFSKTE